MVKKFEDKLCILLSKPLNWVLILPFDFRF